MPEKKYIGCIYMFMMMQKRHSKKARNKIVTHEMPMMTGRRKSVCSGGSRYLFYDAPL